jgi:hypothetical protein
MVLGNLESFAQNVWKQTNLENKKIAMNEMIDNFRSSKENKLKLKQQVSGYSADRIDYFAANLCNNIDNKVIK